MPKDRPRAAKSSPDALQDPARSDQKARLVFDGSRWLLRAGEQDAEEHRAPGIVPALENAIAVIVYINKKSPRPVGLSEITATLNISKSHCHSILKTLVHFNWLSFDDDSKSYRLQSGLISDASSLINAPAIATIRPHLVDLVQRLSLPCVLTEPLADGSFVVVDRFNAQHFMEVSFPIGHRFSRNAAAQMRAYIAWQPPQALERWMQDWAPTPYTSDSILDPDSIRAEVGRTRRRGYARSVGEITEGLMAMALPIFDRAGKVAYIFNISSLVQSLLEREDEVAREMLRTAARIHRDLAALVPADMRQE